MEYASPEIEQALRELPEDMRERILQPTKYRDTITYRWFNPDFQRIMQEWKQSKCGARTRKGTPCQRRPLWKKKRCRLHGSKSTGPRTAEGKAAIAESNRRRAATKQAANVGEENA